MKSPRSFSRLLSLFAASLLMPGALCAGAVFTAPAVTNVAYIQQPDGAGETEVVVTYDLASPNGDAEVTLQYSTNGGADFSTATAMTGDVGVGIAPGTGLTIDWAVGVDLPGEEVTGNFVVRVIANDGVEIPLTITATVAQDAGTATAAQTVTFTFAEGVTGFDATDVTVSGGTQGTFTANSASEYALEVTASGFGTIEISVATDAAIAESGTGIGTAADSHDWYYESYAWFLADTWTINLPGDVPMEFVHIPAGTFTMGSPVGETSRNTNEAEHQVTLTRDFYLGRTEVTQDQWAALQAFPLAQSSLGGTMPVHNVSHTDIESWLTDLDTEITEPGSFALPTESQWEYAARAATTTRFNFGDGFGTNENCSAETERTDNMWYCGNSGLATQPVGQKAANDWGLRDMHGNVWEWCADWYSSSYPAGPVTDPTGPGSAPNRTLRGGSWANNAHLCRSARRGSLGPSSQDPGVGFRVLAVR